MHEAPVFPETARMKPSHNNILELFKFLISSLLKSSPALFTISRKNYHIIPIPPELCEY